MITKQEIIINTQELFLNKEKVSARDIQENPARLCCMKISKEKIIRGQYRGAEDKDICKFMEWRYIGK